jgi:hypothetical protein
MASQPMPGGDLFNTEVRMNARHALYGWILGAAAVVGGVTSGTGCDRTPTRKATADKPTPPPSGQEVGRMAAEAEAKARAAAGVAADKVKAAGANTADAVSNAVNDAKASDAARNAQATAGNAAEKVKAEGNDLLAKLDAAIKSNKLDEGQTYVDAFERIQDNVPAEVKAKYDALKARFAAARAKAAEPNK